MYWLIPQQYVRLRNLFLLVVSYILYCLFTPVFALVLIYVSLVTFYGAKTLYNSEQLCRQKLLITLASAAFLPLLIFKYYNFVSDNLQDFFALIGVQPLPGLNWAIPVGISFYSFQAIGYLFDVYYKKIRCEDSILNYLLFVGFFPQVASGPISKGAELLPQLKEQRSFNYQQGVKGLQYLLWGMFLKVVVADRLGIYVDTVYANYVHYSGVTLFVASIFYSFQIYTDFAGYSLMAIGIARTLGVDLINNFRQPYFSVSITDFWRRWHISLSRWLKDYVYIPLGGSRCSKLKCYRNILITFLVSGLWHGANWTFIIWGMGHGLVQTVEKAMGVGKLSGKMVCDIPRIIFTFFMVNLLWILFRVPNLQVFSDLLYRTVASPFSGELCKDSFSSCVIGILIVLFKDFLCEKGIINQILYWNRVSRWAVYITLFVMIILFGVLDSGQFIYVSF